VKKVLEENLADPGLMAPTVVLEWQVVRATKDPPGYEGQEERTASQAVQDHPDRPERTGFP
jgi:hypothetical protein